MDDELAEVESLELLLHDSQVRNDPQRLLSMLHDEFYEYGASGRTWTRASIAEAAAGTPQVIAATHIEARHLGSDAVLITYLSESGGQHTLRSSTWVREGDQWLMLFHQGTVTDTR